MSINCVVCKYYNNCKYTPIGCNYYEFYKCQPCKFSSQVDGNTICSKNSQYHKSIKVCTVAKFE